MKRDFAEDFLLPAVNHLPSADKTRIAIALDCAVAFGALELLDGNESLMDQAALEKKYAENVKRLKALNALPPQTY